jgi:hypothetical protein
MTVAQLDRTSALVFSIAIVFGSIIFALMAIEIYDDKTGTRNRGIATLLIIVLIVNYRYIFTSTMLLCHIALGKRDLLSIKNGYVECVGGLVFRAKLDEIDCAMISPGKFHYGYRSLAIKYRGNKKHIVWEFLCDGPLNSAQKFIQQEVENCRKVGV